MDASDRKAELEQLGGLVKVVGFMVEHYRSTITQETDCDAAVQRAAARLDDALLDCMRKATDELAAPSADWFFDCTACGPHDLERDLRVLQTEEANPTKRNKVEPAAVLLMRVQRYEFSHAQRAIAELRERGLIPAEAASV